MDNKGLKYIEEEQKEVIEESEESSSSSSSSHSLSLSVVSEKDERDSLSIDETKN
jgi:hypothetical protein